MPPLRIAYPPDCRRQMVDLVRSGRTPEELAREFEPISASVKQAERDAGKRVDAPTSAERKELGHLRRENHRLRQERDILAKAVAWFARESKARPNGFTVYRFMSGARPRIPLAPWPAS
jgi:transposase